MIEGDIRFDPPRCRSIGHAGPLKTSGVHLEGGGGLLHLHIINSRGGISHCRITMPLSSVGDLIGELTKIALLAEQ